ncbi:MAG: glyoxalase/bleomycin resistance protein/dioxygenase [Acidimicrobiales bacterium]|nr:glyoxalase/bleomycin resistance protein/dioxygenase [Acidimicrobiales bacterium]
MISPMLSTSDLVAFVPASDIDRARAFYSETLGLTLVEETPAACQFDAHGTMLRVTPVEGLAPASYTVLGWAVLDIAATVRFLEERGVLFMRFEGMEQDDLGVWTAPGGDQVAWFSDPAGNTLSLTQFR